MILAFFSSSSFVICFCHLLIYAFYVLVNLVSQQSNILDFVRLSFSSDSVLSIKYDFFAVLVINYSPLCHYKPDFLLWNPKADIFSNIGT